MCETDKEKLKVLYRQIEVSHILKIGFKPDLVGCICNPYYWEGRGRRIMSYIQVNPSLAKTLSQKQKGWRCILSGRGCGALGPIPRLQKEKSKYRIQNHDIHKWFVILLLVLLWMLSFSKSSLLL
jgi:hypothetical protein